MTLLHFFLFGYAESALTVGLALLGILSGWQFYNKRSYTKLVSNHALELKAVTDEKGQWETTAHAAEVTVSVYQKELELVRESRDRAGMEKEALQKKVGALEAKTDLDSVRTQLEEMRQAFGREMAEAKLILVQTIQTVSKEIMLGFGAHAKADEALQQRNVDLMVGLEQRMTRGFEALGVQTVKSGETGKAAPPS